jgi:exonuclease SbcC
MMIAPLIISGMRVEGFRGINTSVDFDFENRSVIIHGNNGVGKSTILQAIEWCLMGKCAHMELDEFGREDALVNMFHSDRRASVTLRLTDGKKEVQLKRERKMGKTTRGKSQFILTDGKVEYEGPTAEEKLLELLGITPEQFYAATYLRQEAIRDFIVGDAQDRGRVIDELLGMETLRQLSEAVTVKDVEGAVKEVEKEIAEIQESKILALELARKKLMNYREELKNKGFTEKKLNSGNLVQMANDIGTELVELAAALKVPSPKFGSAKEDITSLEDSHARLGAHLEELDRERFGFFKRAENARSKLQDYLNKYKEVGNQLAELEQQDVEELQKKIDKLEDEIKPLEVERDDKKDLADFLNDKKTVLKGLQSEANKAKGKLRKLDKYGSGQQIEKAIRAFEQEMVEAARLKKEIGAYTQLLKSAADFLGEAKPEKCPICNTPVEYAKLRKELLSRMSKAEETKIAKIEAQIDELKDKKKEYKDAAAEIEELTEEITAVDSNLTKEIQGIERKMKIRPKEPFDDFMAKHVGNLRDSAKQLDEKIMVSRKKSLELDAQLKKLRETVRRKEKLEEEIQHALASVQADGKLIQTLQQQIKDAQAQIDSLSKINERFPALKSELSGFKGILEYLEEGERVKKLEEEIPGVKERIQELEEQSGKLQELFMGLSDIGEALKAEKESILQSTLDKLQVNVSSYYSRILGHPYFVNLQLTAEEEKKGIMYRIVAYDESNTTSTYVQTRFSNAQTNVTALSLFLAMAEATTSRLGMLILDDPGQSLDSDHKKALASMLADEANKKQVIVATQDGEMSSLIEGAIPKAHLKSIVIEGWTPQAGPKLLSHDKAE